MSDRTLDRWLRWGVVAVAVGGLLFGGYYVRDQHRSAGPSLFSRQVADAEALVRKQPGDVGARLQLAVAYEADERLDDALKQYDEVLKDDANHRAALLGRGGVLMKKEELADAAAAFRKITGAAVKGEFAGADPQLAEAHYYLGSIALKQGAPKAAILELLAALKIDRADSDALYLLGVARLKDGAPQLAVEALQQALLFVPTGWCEPYVELVSAYDRLRQAPQQEFAGAMVDFCEKRTADAKRRLAALTPGPMTVDALLKLGLIAETESENAEAVDWYQKALEVDPANISAIAALSRLGVKAPVATASPSPRTEG